MRFSAFKIVSDGRDRQAMDLVDNLLGSSTARIDVKRLGRLMCSMVVAGNTGEKRKEAWSSPVVTGEPKRE